MKRPAHVLQETERFRLRPVERGDLDALAAMVSHPEVTRFTYGSPRTREEAEGSLQRGLDHWERYGFGPFATFPKEGGGLVGRTGLVTIEDTGQVHLGLMFVPEWWGRGAGTELCRALCRWGFEELDLDRVFGLALPGNLGSRRMLEKAGLQADGWQQLLGQEMVRYVLLRDAWRDAGAATGVRPSPG